jgi:hypothetical protein
MRNASSESSALPRRIEGSFVKRLISFKDEKLIGIGAEMPEKSIDMCQTSFIWTRKRNHRQAISQRHHHRGTGPCVLHRLEWTEIEIKVRD